MCKVYIIQLIQIWALHSQYIILANYMYYINFEIILMQNYWVNVSMHAWCSYISFTIYINCTKKLFERWQSNSQNSRSIHGFCDTGRHVNPSRITANRRPNHSMSIMRIWSSHHSRTDRRILYITVYTYGKLRYHKTFPWHDTATLNWYVT